MTLCIDTQARCLLHCVSYTGEPNKEIKRKTPFSSNLLHTTVNCAYFKNYCIFLHENLTNAGEHANEHECKVPMPYSQPFLKYCTSKLYRRHSNYSEKRKFDNDRTITPEPLDRSLRNFAHTSVCQLSTFSHNFIALPPSVLALSNFHSHFYAVFDAIFTLRPVTFEPLIRLAQNFAQASTKN